MSRNDVVRRLIALAKEARDGDAERPHKEADELLLAYIGDARIRTVFESMRKWYA